MSLIDQKTDQRIYYQKRPKLGPRLPWLCFLSEINATIFLRGSYYFPFLFRGSHNYHVDTRKIEVLFETLLNNGFYNLSTDEDFYLRFPPPRISWQNFILNLPRVNIYSPEWTVDTNLTTGAIVPYIKHTASDADALLALSISTSNSLTYLGGTHEKGETILETTLREFEEETRTTSGSHVLTPLNMADLHGVPYLMRGTVVLFFVYFNIDDPIQIVQETALSGNPETAGLFWVSWGQLQVLLDRAVNPALVDNQNFYPFYLTMKLKQTLIC